MVYYLVDNQTLTKYKIPDEYQTQINEQKYVSFKDLKKVIKQEKVISALVRNKHPFFTIEIEQLKKKYNWDQNTLNLVKRINIQSESINYKTNHLKSLNDGIKRYFVKQKQEKENLVPYYGLPFVLIGSACAGYFVTNIFVTNDKSICFIASGICLFIGLILESFLIIIFEYKKEVERQTKKTNK